MVTLELSPKMKTTKGCLRTAWAEKSQKVALWLDIIEFETENEIV